MDFSRFTDQQSECVRHLDGPLFIAAGAGSGKTFTLQNRIAWALMEESQSGIHSIDEVLAITFMEKAAAEIKARVRSALREAGMVEEALKVDSAWISTIHGMCSRILREHALEAGVDPAFVVLNEFDAKNLRRDAIEEVLRAEEDSEEYAALFAEYGIWSTGRQDKAAFEMLEAILSKTASFSRGLDALNFGPEPLPASRIAKQLKDRYAEAVAYGESIRDPKKKQATLNKSIDQCNDGICALEKFLSEEDSGISELAAILSTFKPVPKNAFGNHDPSGHATDAIYALDWAIGNVNAALARPHAKTLESLARKVDASYQAKLDAMAALDNNGLLHRTLAMLKDHPEITARYQQRFKLVMVDEFQDTNQLQVDLIELVAGNARLCTVGDAQQSIYRFNGADVSVFNARKAMVEKSKQNGANALESNLDQNFRSHKDILAFVRKVCGSPRVFGKDFLDLQASRKKQEGLYKGSSPRIDLQLVAYRGSKEGSGALEAEAAMIAERFAQLREAGHQPGEMVVLLSKTTNADIYAEALRARGFECVLEGGKSFFAKSEVQVVVSLLTALANPSDSKELFAVLASPMLHLSADDFLALGTSTIEDGSLKPRRLERGLIAKLPEGASPALRHAASIFARARSRVKTDRPSQVLMGALLDSGWLPRLEREGAIGSSQAANILKALRLVEELERKPGYGIARVARELNVMAQELGESPASLSVSGQNAVRLLTIHKSKGLEFPIVAAVDFEPRKNSSRHFKLTTNNGSIYIALSMKASRVEWNSGSNSPQSTAEPKLNDADPVRFALAIDNHDWAEELEEARRKFYVACTRSSEYLLVSGLVSLPKSSDSAEENPIAAYKNNPILDDVRAALCGEMADFPDHNSSIDYKGSEPARFTRIAVSKDAPFTVDKPQDDAPSSLIEIPVLEENEASTVRPIPFRSGVFSYSSIAPEEDHLPVLERDDVSTSKPSLAKPNVDETEDNETIFDVEDGFPGANYAWTPSATDVGSAFHRVGQLAIERLPLTNDLVSPPAEAIDAIARSLRIEGPSRLRLDTALERWFGSSIAHKAASFASIRAEVPFMVGVPFDEEDYEESGIRFLEGEIDLLAENADKTYALVIDYKTGGSPTESDDRLKEKHQLQSVCYAYALLTTQRYDTVEFAFVRVEQQDPISPREPQVVRYAYTQDDCDTLKNAIIAAYRKKQQTA